MTQFRWIACGFILGAALAVAPGCSGTAAGKCSAATCAGCCNGNTCVAAPSATQCGSNGAACTACGAGQACTAGTCVTGGTGGGTGTGGGAGGNCSDGCIAAANGQCLRSGNNATSTFCGTGGAACANCASQGKTCSQTTFTCVGGNTGGGSGSTGGGSGSTGGGSGSTGGGSGSTGGGSGTNPTPGQLGGTCNADGDCTAALGSGAICKKTTTSGAAYSGGFCTKPCASAGDCAGGKCTAGLPLNYYGEADSICVPTCTTSCRAGYECYAVDPADQTTGGCWLDPFPDFEGGGPATKVGTTCSDDTACTNPPSAEFGFCFPSTLSDGGVSAWQSGYCSADCTFDNTDTFCGTNATCVGFTEDFYACLQTCATLNARSTCRTGYTCFDVGLQTGGVCTPDCSQPGWECESGTTCNTTTGACQ